MLGGNQLLSPCVEFAFAELDADLATDGMTARPSAATIELPRRSTQLPPALGGARRVLDTELATRASAELRRSSYRAMHRVSCDAFNCVLTLRGQVPSYFMKQIAQATVGKVDGVREVDNQLVVSVARPHARDRSRR